MATWKQSPHHLEHLEYSLITQEISETLRRQIKEVMNNFWCYEILRLFHR